MSAPIDVREILARIARTNAQFATTADRDQMVRVGETMLKKQAADLQSVLEALDELVGAAQAVENSCVRHDANDADLFRRLDAAIARVKGGAA
ncbi:hypothetical protein K7566_08610 [Stenotrophomonas maltophilia]|uniref:hypothetical protein n=1 Tax=Stenotrophomonas maltophilia TaxID=40324 RepID=UPI001D1303B8|nr:hypothetical protein [Stenotrophomonas maltophilia]UXB21744.1 hypothetical protein K7566_08610 [Stenotrophomonas maltophilia]